MYIYINTTEAALQENFTKLLEIQERVRNGTGQDWRHCIDRLHNNGNFWISLMEVTDI